LLLHELGGSSESWREVIRLLATDRRVLAVDMPLRWASEKPPGAFALADVADDLDELLRRAESGGTVDVIGAALGSLAGALLAIRHPATVRRLMMCAVAPDMAGPTRAYLAERPEKVRVVGMRGWRRRAWQTPFRHPTRRSGAAYRGILPGKRPGCYAELSLVLGGWRWPHPIGVRSARASWSPPGRHDFCGRLRSAVKWRC